MTEAERCELGKESWNISQKISNPIYRVYVCRIWEDNEMRVLKDSRPLFGIYR